MRSTAITFVLATLVAAPAAADVTISATQSGKAMMMDLSGASVIRIKGNKMRMDNTQGDKSTSIILDVDGQRMIAIDNKKKEAVITPVAKIQEAMAKSSPGQVKAKVTPTGETKTIAGYACKVHDVLVEVPFQMGGPEMSGTMVLSGPACLSKDAPGYADYVRLYTTVAEKGFILGDPKQLEGPGAATSRGITNYQKAMAEAGVSLEQQLNMTMKAEGPMAMMGKMFKINMGHVVTKVEAGDVDAALFDVPAGYKVKQN